MDGQALKRHLTHCWVTTHYLHQSCWNLPFWTISGCSDKCLHKICLCAFSTHTTRYHWVRGDIVCYSTFVSNTLSGPVLPHLGRKWAILGPWEVKDLQQAIDIIATQWEVLHTYGVFLWLIIHHIISWMIKLWKVTTTYGASRLATLKCIVRAEIGNFEACRV